MAAIVVRQLAFAYPSASARAVAGISFEVREGKIFGFLGPSGAGKSTTQRILIRLLRSYQGAIEVFQRELSLWDRSYYQRIGVQFELPNHYAKLTARENLALFGSLYAGPQEDPRALLSLVGLADAADTRVGRFSKGMQMRLSFVRALLHRPALLFLDEPTAGLDPANARTIVRHIQRLQEEGTTIFLTTHDMRLADELCDRVAFIADGRIALIDSLRNLKLRDGTRRVTVEFRDGARRVQRAFDLQGIGKNAAFLELLHTRAIETLHTQEATLEDVFIQVTGQGLA